jgi:hypothetical protein
MIGASRLNRLLTVPKKLELVVAARHAEHGAKVGVGHRADVVVLVDQHFRPLVAADDTFLDRQGERPGLVRYIDVPAPFRLDDGELRVRLVGGAEELPDHFARRVLLAGGE